MKMTMRGKTFTLRALSLLSISAAILICFVSISYAAGAFKLSKDDMRDSSIIGAPIVSNSGSTISSIADFDIKNSSPSIGLDSLYGVENRHTVYNGEVPSKDDYNGDYKDKPSESSANIDSTIRNWWNGPWKISSKLTWDNSTTNDIHAMNLSDKNKNINSDLTEALRSGGFTFFAFINMLLDSLVKILIYIGNLDVSFIETLDPFGLVKSITTILIGDGKTYSPVLILALIVFMIGIVGIVAKRAKSGDASAMEIVQEAGMFVLAMILVGVSINGGYDKLFNATTQFSTKIISNLGMSTGSKNALFEYDTGNTTSDVNNSMNAMTSKNFVDLIISQEFGYSVNELDLYGDGVDTQALWGIDADKMKWIVNNVSGDGSTNIAAVSTGGTDNSDSPNLGYFWYAAASGVDNTDPFTDDDGKLTINSASTDRVLYVTDILSAIDAEAGGSAKAQDIMRHMSYTSYNWLEMLSITLVTASMIYALALVAIISLSGKLIFNLGFFAIPILPILILVPSMRDTAKKAFNTWINSAIKMVLAQAMMMIIIYTSAAICSGANVSSYVVDIIVLILFGRFSPVILTKINTAVSSGREQLDFTRNIDSRLASAASTFSRRTAADNNRNISQRNKELEDNRNKMNDKENTHDYSDESDHTVDSMLDNFKTNTGGPDNRNNSNNDNSDNSDSGNNGNNNYDGGLSVFDVDDIRNSDEFNAIKDDLSSKNESIDSMSDSDIANSLNIDGSALEDVTNKEREMKERDKAKEDSNNASKIKIQSALTSPLANAVARTRVGGTVIDGMWSLNDKLHDTSGGGIISNVLHHNGIIHSITHDMSERNIDNKKRAEYDKEVTYNGKKMKLSDAIELERKSLKDKAKDDAKSRIRDIAVKKAKPQGDSSNGGSTDNGGGKQPSDNSGKSKTGSTPSPTSGSRQPRVKMDNARGGDSGGSNSGTKAASSADTRGSSDSVRAQSASKSQKMSSSSFKKENSGNAPHHVPTRNDGDRASNTDRNIKIKRNKPNDKSDNGSDNSEER